MVVAKTSGRYPVKLNIKLYPPSLILFSSAQTIDSPL